MKTLKRKDRTPIKGEKSVVIKIILKTMKKILPSMSCLIDAALFSSPETIETVR